MNLMSVLKVVPRKTDAAVLYEIFIRSSQRRNGFGRTILGIAESIAQEKKFPCLQLRPHSLDPSFSDEDLKNWYFDQGYKLSEVHDGLLEKKLEL